MASGKEIVEELERRGMEFIGSSGYAGSWRNEKNKYFTNYETIRELNGNQINELSDIEIHFIN